VVDVVNIRPLDAVSQGEIVAAMSLPTFYSPIPDTVERRETHGSTVFLAGDRAYKVKKPVRFEFLDYSTVELRRRMCEEEVALNRRLAPRMYLGVRSIVRSHDGFELAEPERRDALEYAVEMRRFDEAHTLASSVGRHSVDAGQVREIGTLIAEFHARAAVVGHDDPRPQVKRTAGENFASLLELSGSEREPDLCAAQRFTDAFLVRRRDVFLERSEAGLIRDGHGDLRAEHVILSDPLQIVDCIEFDPALRQTDVASDLAFLVMDLHRLGAPNLVDDLLAGYREAGGDPGDQGLIAFYAAQRAWVRAKVALLRARTVEQAGALLDLGTRFAWQARQPLLLVLCGLSGSGKSHLAQHLAARSGAEVISSDIERKRLARADHADGIYTAEFNARTYGELGRLAATQLGRTGVAIVDATFRNVEDRQAFSQAAGEAFSAARFVECLAPRDLRIRRVDRRQRQRDPSDATPRIAGNQVFEELAEISASRHLPLRTDRPAGATVSDIERWLDSPLG
jgi:uncharacterized protein